MSTTHPADERIAGTHKAWRHTIENERTICTQNFGHLEIKEAARILYRIDGHFFADYPGGVARCEVLPCGDMVISHVDEEDEGA